MAVSAARELSESEMKLVFQLAAVDLSKSIVGTLRSDDHSAAVDVIEKSFKTKDLPARQYLVPLVIRQLVIEGRSKDADVGDVLNTAKKLAREYEIKDGDFKTALIQASEYLLSNHSPRYTTSVLAYASRELGATRKEIVSVVVAAIPHQIYHYDISDLNETIKEFSLKHEEYAPAVAKGISWLIDNGPAMVIPERIRYLVDKYKIDKEALQGAAIEGVKLAVQHTWSSDCPYAFMRMRTGIGMARLKPEQYRPAIAEGYMEILKEAKERGSPFLVENFNKVAEWLGPAELEMLKPKVLELAEKSLTDRSMGETIHLLENTGIKISELPTSAGTKAKFIEEIAGMVGDRKIEEASASMDALGLTSADCRPSLEDPVKKLIEEGSFDEAAKVIWSFDFTQDEIAELRPLVMKTAKAIKKNGGVLDGNFAPQFGIKRKEMEALLRG